MHVEPLKSKRRERGMKGGGVRKRERGKRERGKRERGRERVCVEREKGREKGRERGEREREESIHSNFES